MTVTTYCICCLFIHLVRKELFNRCQHGRKWRCITNWLSSTASLHLYFAIRATLYSAELALQTRQLHVKREKLTHWCIGASKKTVWDKLERKKKTMLALPGFIVTIMRCNCNTFTRIHMALIVQGSDISLSSHHHPHQSAVGSLDSSRSAVWPSRPSRHFCFVHWMSIVVARWPCSTLQGSSSRKVSSMLFCSSRWKLMVF